MPMANSSLPLRYVIELIDPYLLLMVQTQTDSETFHLGFYINRNVSIN